MKSLNLLFLVFAFGLVACEGTIELGEDTIMPGLTPAASGKADATGTTPAALNGGALYQQYCGSCHGADATGGGSYPSSILGFTPVEGIIVNGVGVMPAIPMTPAEIVAVQGFLLGDTGTTPVTETTPVNEGSTPALQMYAAECSSCHGAEGLGTERGPTLRMRDPGLARFTVRQGRNGPGNPSVMPVYDRTAVSDAQLDEVIEWLDAFPNPTTGEGLYTQYCATCHGATGLGGTSFNAIAGQLRAESIIRTGHGGQNYTQRSNYMTAWTADQISDDEIVLIELYMREL